VTGSATVPLATFGISPEVPGATGDSHYTLNVILTDKASGASGTVNFAGPAPQTDPSFLGGRTHVTFTSPDHQSLVLGSHLFNVAVRFDGDPTPGLWHGGTFSAVVQGADAPQAPEPSTLVLAGMGLVAGLGPTARRGRRADLAIVE